MSLPIRLFASLVGLSFALGCHQVHFEVQEGSGEIQIPDDLFSVSPVGKDRAVASGYWGAIYLTEDGGATWRAADTGTDRLIYDVSMADAQHGWAVGQVGLVLRTEDGGASWQRQSTPKDDQGVHIFAVQALDKDRAWAVGEWGTRIYTDDGGQSWQERSLTVNETHPMFVWLSISEQDKVRNGEMVFEDVGLGDVYCLPENTNYCWIIGEFAYLFRTEDGGMTWERGVIQSGTQVDPVLFAYNEIEINEEDFDRVRAFAETIVDQQHLNVAVYPFASAKEIKNFGSVDDPFPLFDIIEARTQEIGAAVEDAGVNTDRIRRRAAPPWDYEDFLEDDPEFLTRYLDSRVADQGQVKVEIAQNPYLFTVRFADQDQGYISGLGGVVLRSEDGGRTWRYEDIGRKAALFSVFPFPGGRSVVVGEKGIALQSEDGGETWAQIENYPELFTYMRDVQFEPTGQVGYAVGQDGRVLRSEDAGNSWTQVFPKQEATEIASAD